MQYDSPVMYVEGCTLHSTSLSHGLYACSDSTHESPLFLVLATEISFAGQLTDSSVVGAENLGDLNDRSTAPLGYGG